MPSSATAGAAAAINNQSAEGTAYQQVCAVKLLHTPEVYPVVSRTREKSI